MAQNFLSCDRGQAMLLPESIADWLPEGHLARFVIDTVEQLDLAGFYAAYRADGSGRPAHDPAMMVALVLYSYAVGVTSSRLIERRCVEDVATRFIAANRVPDHVTINRFRSRHEDALSGLFGEVLALCAKAGMVRAATVAVDGTKMAADASLGANYSYDRLREEARRIVQEAGQVDAAEDELYGQRRGDELPEELADASTRKRRIRELLDELDAEREQAQREHDAKRQRHAEHLAKTGKRLPGRPPNASLPKEQADALFARRVNLTDPDSRIVQLRGMKLQGYNAQIAVADGQVIVAARIATAANDVPELEPMTRAAHDELLAAGVDAQITTVLADAGYWNTKGMDALTDQGIEVLVSPRDLLRTGPRKSAPRQGPHARRFEDTIASPAGAARYRRRQQIVEPVFAHIKHLRGITRFSRRGRQAVTAEWQLIATTHNLLKLYRHTPATA
jgi:transposase